MKAKTMTYYEINVVRSVFRLMLNNKHRFDGGLCMWLQLVHLTTHLSQEHRNIAFKYIRLNRPFKTYFNIPRSGYWWKYNDISPRIEWLEKQIVKLGKEIVNRKN